MLRAVVAPVAARARVRARLAGAFAVTLALTLGASPAPAAAGEPGAEAAPAATPEPRPAGAGLVVVAEGAGTEDAARRLAYALYRTSLRPAAVDERVARVLVGEPPADDASADVHELAELRAGVHGDDAASRQLLVAVARRTGARGVVLVREGPVARPFDATTGAFEPVTLQPDAGGGWSSAVAWLDRGTPAPAASSRRAPPPALATSEVPRAASRPFYASPWLWAGVAGAVALGALFFVATSGGNEAGVPLRLDVAR